MCTDHIFVKRKIKEMRKSDFLNMLDELMLSEMQKEIMMYVYIENKTMQYIADYFGYSEIGIIKIHEKILKKIAKTYLQT